MTYAIIQVGGKQYRVHPGEKLLVDRLAHGEGKTFSPRVLLVGGDGPADLAPKDGVVTARVVSDLRGPKIRIGKYKKRTGYKRHNGFRAALTQIEIESIGAKKAQAAAPAPPATAGFLRPRPPRVPRRVFFFGLGSPSPPSTSVLPPGPAARVSPGSPPGT